MGKTTYPAGHPKSRWTAARKAKFSATMKSVYAEKKARSVPIDTPAVPPPEPGTTSPAAPPETTPKAPSLREAVAAKGKSKGRYGNHIVWDDAEIALVVEAYAQSGPLVFGTGWAKRMAKAMSVLPKKRRRPLHDALRKTLTPHFEKAGGGVNIDAAHATGGTSIPLDVIPAPKGAYKKKGTEVAAVAPAHINGNGKTNGNGNGSAHVASPPPLAPTVAEARLIVAHELIQAVRDLLR